MGGRICADTILEAFFDDRARSRGVGAAVEFQHTKELYEQDFNLYSTFLHEAGHCRDMSAGAEAASAPLAR